MEEKANAILENSRCCKEEEDAIARTPEDNNAPDEIRKQSEGLTSHRKVADDELLGENIDSMEETQKPNTKYSMPMELDVMVLERVQPDDLKNVTRVKKAWRFYAAANRHRLRLLLVQSIIVTIPSKYPVVIEYLKQADKIQTYQYFRRYISMSRLLNYKPERYLKLVDNEDYNDDALRVEQAHALNAVPDWWLEQIKKVKCMFFLEDDVFDGEINFAFPFIQRFTHLRRLFLEAHFSPETQHRMVDFIEKGPQIDFFSLTVYYEGRIGKNRILIDDMLAAAMRRSWITPAEFPDYVGHKQYSVAQVIKFIEGNKFTSEKIHEIYVYSALKGRKEDLTEWLDRNATMLPYPHIDDSFSHGDRWKFTYRGETFDVWVDSQYE